MVSLMGWGAHAARVEDSLATQATRMAMEGWEPGPGQMPRTHIHPIHMNVEGWMVDWHVQRWAHELLQVQGDFPEGREGERLGKGRKGTWLVLGQESK